MHALKMLDRDFVGDLSPRERKNRRPGLVAARRTASGGVMLVWTCAAILLATAGHSAMVLLSVPVVFAVSLLRALRRGVGRRNQIERIALPDPIWYSDADAQAGICRLENARRALAQSVRRNPHGADENLLERLPGVDLTERRIIVLAARVQYMGEFLTANPVSRLEAQLAHIYATEVNIWTDDRSAKAHTSIAEREMQLCDLRSLARKRALLLARMDHLLVTLERLPLTLTRLHLIRAEAAQDDDGATADAAHLRSDLEAVDEVFLHHGERIPAAH
ncbi:MAG TPA: hypothetical protein VGL59_16700 [Polyangia bacterium]